MPQRHKDLRANKDLQELESKQKADATSILQEIFQTFGFLQKLKLAMPQCHKDLRANKDLQELASK